MTAIDLADIEHKDDSYGGCCICRECIPRTDDEYVTVPFPCPTVRLRAAEAREARLREALAEVIEACDRTVRGHARGRRPGVEVLLRSVAMIRDAARAALVLPEPKRCAHGNNPMSCGERESADAPCPVAPADPEAERVHGGRHRPDDTREDCPQCWDAAYRDGIPSEPEAER